jgi:CHASE3 domain sensor protein
MKKFISANWIIIVIGIAFIASTILALRNNAIIEKNQLVLQQTEMVKKTTQDILTKIMHGLDLGVRGYGLTHDDQLLIPYKEATTITPQVFKRIDSLLALQNYEKRNEALEVMTAIQEYIALSKDMIQKASNDNMPAFIAILKEDKGYNVWSKYSKFSVPLFAFEDELNHKSYADYQFAIKSNLILQISILVLIMPLLYTFVQRVNKERQRRQQTLKEVDYADRTYVFNDGQETGILSEEINSRSVSHIKEASEFIASLAGDNYEVQWHGLNDENLSLNDHTLAGNLFSLRDRLKVVKQEDEKRNWMNEGITQFSELVRSLQHDPDQLSIKCISFLIKYLKAQQGSLFVVEGEAPDQYLQLMGCYAFDRRKFIDKKIEIGNGLVGQAYMEGEPILLKQVPQGYTTITSGLGDATPTCMAIVPLKHDLQTVAIIEIATFKEIEPYQITFIQKAGEFLASAITNTRTTIKMKTLLDEASIKEVMMREREEELKQNMEELQATQEQLARNNQELKSA